MSKKTKKKDLPDLIPPDPKQCQAEKPNGHSFMTLGGVPGLVRCRNKPFVIATEVKPGDDGRRGSMSLCSECFVVIQRKMPGHCTFEPVEEAS